MKEYVIIIDPFVMDQKVYSCEDKQLVPVATFQLAKMETYAPVLTLLSYCENEQITLNLKCPLAFREKIKEKIYNLVSAARYDCGNLIIKDI